MRRSFRISLGIGGENADQALASGLCQHALGNAASSDRCRGTAEKQATLHITLLNPSIFYIDPLPDQRRSTIR